MQERANRFFYGERYDLRQGLLDFGRTLSATTALEPLLDGLIDRLKQVLDVEKSSRRFWGHFGAKSQLYYDRSVFDSRRIFVSNPELTGRTIASLNLSEKIQCHHHQPL
ncbi:MAG: hypothetical protein HC932_02605 [Thermales bacterium]|nr:hypothetical protein [Thermales bacterium]